jgi:hypothetical protein
MDFNIIGFLCNPTYFIFCIWKHYSEKRSIGFTRLPKGSIAQKRLRTAGLVAVTLLFSSKKRPHFHTHKWGMVNRKRTCKKTLVYLRLIHAYNGGWSIICPLTIGTVKTYWFGAQYPLTLYLYLYYATLITEYTAAAFYNFYLLFYMSLLSGTKSDLHINSWYPAVFTLQ